VIPAAGLGMRLAASSDRDPEPKALRLLEGRSLLARSAAVLAPLVEHVVVAAPGDRLDQVRRQLWDLAAPFVVVPGGRTRQASVGRALDAIDPSVELVLVHDAARPLVPRVLVERVIAALDDGSSAVVPGLAVADSLREETEVGSRPLDRSRVRAVQTPQGFRLEVLREAHRRADTFEATDDASLVELLGTVVTLVPGDPLAFKITRPLDLLLAETLLAGR
jgi:2-C-methyl-D-erythritol 4-phosphate cytidylyltransferase